MLTWTDVTRVLRGGGEQVDPVRQKVSKRLDRLPTVDVLNWADEVGSGLARALDDYRRQSTPEPAGGPQGAQSLLGVLDVLSSREA